MCQFTSIHKEGNLARKNDAGHGLTWPPCRLIQSMVAVSFCPSVPCGGTLPHGDTPKVQTSKSGKFFDVVKFLKVNRFNDIKCLVNSMESAIMSWQFFTRENDQESSITINILFAFSEHELGQNQPF